MLFNPTDYTTVFLSYDEPNCEENYRHLLSLNPQALRVHGVKGSDTAHKEVAKLSKTDNVIIVDGDNFVKHDFFTTTIELPTDVNLNTSVLSFSAYNTINGNSYGNGGIKVWPVNLIEDMKTHENGSGIDFDLSKYVELDTVASEIRFASDYQAFRAGFREGVKLMLNDGYIGSEISDYRNVDRLWLWSHVGSDVEHGRHAILGTRLAIQKVLTEMFDDRTVIDVDNIKELYKDSTNEINEIFYDIRKHLNIWFYCDALSEEDSKRVRESHIAPYRTRDNLDDPFMAWSHYFRLGAKLTNTNELNKMCTIGRSTEYGTYKIDGAIMGREHKEAHKHDSTMLGKIFDYAWLKEHYDRLYTDSI